MKTLFLLLSLSLALNLNAQIQQGIVKTIGRPNRPGTVLGNVTIRVQGMVNAVISDETGKFRITVPKHKDGEAIVLVSVRKNGYELKDKDLIGRPLAFSPRVPVEIMMVDTKQLAADKRRIEENAMRVAERNYKQKLQKLEKQKSENEVTVEKYHQELQALQDNYEKYISLIGGMADRYARTDYDQWDSLDREINICIENGELDKADSLIHTVFDPETVLERNRAAKEDIHQRIATAQNIIDQANKDKKLIQQDAEYAGRITALCDKLAEEYLTLNEREKAISCLKQSLEIKTILYGSEDNRTLQTLQKINALKK